MPGIAGLPSLPSVMLEHAGHRLEREVVRRPVAVGAVLAERADRAVDDARVARANGVVVRRRGARIDARAGTIPRTRRPSRRARSSASRPSADLQVEHHALLAAVEVAEEHRARAVGQADVAPGIALARRLDLDHLGAVVGQRQGEIRPRQEHREIDDADALELHAAPPVGLTACTGQRSAALSAPSGEHTRLLEALRRRS